MSESPLGDALGALARFYVGDSTVEQALLRVSELVTQAVPAADFVGLTMLIEGRNRTAIFTDPAAPEIDQAQYDTGEGPCLSAFEQQDVFSVHSTREAGPWPAFRKTALAHGILSSLSLPMATAQGPVGAMNLYSRTEDGFNATDTEIGQLFAAQAAIVLANSLAYWDARELADRLGEAMEHRAVIEQAKGMLMAAQKCTEAEAFDILVKASQRENVKLRDIAHRIVDDASRRAEPAT